MRIFGTGSAPSHVPTPTVADAGTHPSAPIPVQGPPLGQRMRVPLGETGLDVYPLMLGGAEFGWTVDADGSHGILDTYLEHGGNAVHTSDSYVGGRSEHIIGQWLRRRGVRDEIVIATRIGQHPDHPGLGPVNLVRAVEASLTRLGVDRIDLVSLDATVQVPSLEDLLATAEWLVGAGKVRAFGAFQFTPEQLVEARVLCSAGYPRLDVLDVPYNLVRREEYEGDLRLVASAQGMAVTPSHALEHGFLAGGAKARSRIVRSVRGAQIVQAGTKRSARRLRAVESVAADLALPPAAVAVAWLLAQRGVVAPIVNAFAAEQVEELMRGVAVRLTRSQLAEIARAA